MCRDPFPGHEVKGQGHTGHLKLRSPWLLEVFAVSAAWLCTYLSETLHLWHTYNIWSDDVSGTIFRIKGQGHMGCSKVLRCPLCQGHTGHLKFLLYPFCGFVLFRPNHFVCGLHTTHEGAMCRAPFSRWKVKGQGQTRRSNFYLVRCMGSSLMLGDTD